MNNSNKVIFKRLLIKFTPTVLTEYARIVRSKKFTTKENVMSSACEADDIGRGETVGSFGAPNGWLAGVEPANGASLVQDIGKMW
jgi:hypothetical protein